MKSERQPSNDAPVAKHGRKPFMIAVAGGPASGKTEVCTAIIQKLNLNENIKFALIKIEDFYRPLSQKSLDAHKRNEYNFDHPSALDLELLEKVVLELEQNGSANLPKYDFNTKQRTQGRTISGVDLVIFSGVFMLYSPIIRNIFDLRVFVDVDSDARLSRLVLRDHVELKKPLALVLETYMKFIKPSMDLVEQTKRFADIVVPRGEENVIAVDMLIHHAREILNERENI